MVRRGSTVRVRQRALQKPAAGRDHLSRKQQCCNTSREASQQYAPPHRRNTQQPFNRVLGVERLVNASVRPGHARSPVFAPHGESPPERSERQRARRLKFRPRGLLGVELDDPTTAELGRAGEVMSGHRLDARTCGRGCRRQAPSTVVSLLAQMMKVLAGISLRTCSLAGRTGNVPRLPTESCRGRRAQLARIPGHVAAGGGPRHDVDLGAPASTANVRAR
jgi:hypothetical protein